MSIILHFLGGIAASKQESEPRWDNEEEEGEEEEEEGWVRARKWLTATTKRG